MARSLRPVALELARNAAAIAANWCTKRQWHNGSLSQSQYVQDCLEGTILETDGRKIAGQWQALFIGRICLIVMTVSGSNGWSPEQIANRLHVDFANEYVHAHCP